MIDDLIGTNQAALMLGVVPGTLNVWRSTGKYNVPFVKVGRKVCYQRSALKLWIENRTETKTVKRTEKPVVNTKQQSAHTIGFLLLNLEDDELALVADFCEQLLAKRIAA